MEKKSGPIKTEIITLDSGEEDKPRNPCSSTSYKIPKKRKSCQFLNRKNFLKTKGGISWAVQARIAYILMKTKMTQPILALYLEERMLTAIQMSSPFHKK